MVSGAGSFLCILIALLVLLNILLLLLQLRKRFSPREKNNELLTMTSGLAMLLGTDHQTQNAGKWEELLTGNLLPIDAEIIALAVYIFKHSYKHLGHLSKLKTFGIISLEEHLFIHSRLLSVYSCQTLYQSIWTYKQIRLSLIFNSK